jgi:flagellar protein FliJ
MKKFRFPLRSVATVRAMRELRARDAFTQAVHAFVRATEDLHRVQRQLAELEDILRDERTRSFRPSDQASFIAAFHSESRREAEAGHAVLEARRAMDAARAAWLETRRDVRIVEKLEVRARLAHRHAADREEQAALDDRTNALAARAAASVP